MDSLQICQCSIQNLRFGEGGPIWWDSPRPADLIGWAKAGCPTAEKPGKKRKAEEEGEVHRVTLGNWKGTWKCKKQMSKSSTIDKGKGLANNLWSSLNAG